MQKTQHFFEESIYLISNHSVARNTIFQDQDMRIRFIDKMEHYLKPLCNIVAFNLKDDEFQLLVKMKTREAFIKNFLSKKKNRDLELSEVPDTTYIFSQAMANFQVSFVKHYNFINGRSGALMAGRFGRKLVESEKELNTWVTKLNGGKKLHQYAKEWADQTIVSCGAYTSEWLYRKENMVKLKENSIYLPLDQINLGGYFDNLPSKKLKDPKRYFTMRFNQLFGPQPGRFY